MEKSNALLLSATVGGIAALAFAFQSSSLFFFLNDDFISRWSWLRIPRSMEDVKQLHAILQLYIDGHFTALAMSYSAVYITLQSLAIPGSIPLAVLGGALFRLEVAMALICLSTGIGSTFCYLISRTVASGLARQYLAGRLTWWRQQVERHRDGMFAYIFVLRLTPVFPGWLLNIAAPHIGIPLPVFILGTVTGVFPTSIIYCHTGYTLAQLSTGADVQIFTVGNVAAIGAVAVLALLPQLMSTAT